MDIYMTGAAVPFDGMGTTLTHRFCSTDPSSIENLYDLSASLSESTVNWK